MTSSKNIVLDVNKSAEKKKEKTYSEKIAEIDAEYNNVSNLNSTNVSIQSSEVKSGKSWWRADEAMTISSAVLIFGILVMMMATIVLKRTSIHPDAVLRLFGTIVIVIGALFLIVAGYSQDQMGPVMGLLGTVAGYLLGKGSPTQTTNHNQNETK